MKCVACGQPNLKKAFIAKDINEKAFEYLICESCETLQISSFDDDLLNYAYHPSYYGGTDEKFKWPFSVLFNFSKKLTAKKIEKLCPKKDARILDVGCGKGSLLMELSKLGYKNLFGNEIHTPEKEVRNITWVNGSFAKMPETSTYDFISLFHVFEHLPNPTEVIQKLTRLGNPGVKILIAIPNADSRQAKKFGPNWLHLDPPRHLHLTPPDTLIKMFEKEGFSCVSENYNSLFYNPFGHLQSWLNEHHSKRDFLYYSLMRGQKINSFTAKLEWLLHLAFAAISFPFYSLLNFRESKARKGATVEFVFQKNL